MDRTTRGFATTPKPMHRNRPDQQGPSRANWTDALNPASRTVNRSLRAADFAQFSRSVHRDLNPRGPLEQLVARQAIRSAWRLKANLDESDPADPVDLSPATDRAARSLEVAIKTLDLLQGRRVEEPPRPDVEPIDEILTLESNEWPVIPDHDEEPPPEAASLADETPIWRDRLVYDFDVSDHSPVVKGTWITVSHIVSLIIDGATWADILRSHPELIEADIRMCVAYAVAEENSATD